MKKLLLIILILFATQISQNANAQIPDDNDGRLYRLCKTWGYLKYFSQHKCEIKWDTLLNSTINEVLAANNNAEFNNALMKMFGKVGNNSFLATSGTMPDTNLNMDNSWIHDPKFSQQVIAFLDTFSINIYPDQSTCFIKFVTDYSINSYLDFRNDPLSMPIDFSNETNRLTTLFYYWNVINYFYPYKNLMNQRWDTTLCEYIPNIRKAETLLDFHKNFLKLVTRINDSHGFTTSNVLSANFWGGNYLPKICFTRVDTLCVVAKVKNLPGVSPGDILIAVKGIPIHEIEDSLALYVPASTPAALYRDIYSEMLRGGNNTSFELTFLDMDDNPYTISAKRTTSKNGWYTWKAENDLTTSYFITECGYGYVNMGMLQRSQVTSMYSLFKNVPVIIFDIRKEPNLWMADYCHNFFPGPFVSAIFYDPALTFMEAPTNYNYLPGWYYKGNDYQNLGSWSNPEPYKGKVYILVNEEVQSFAEYTCQYLSHYPGSKVIGTQTAGADGNTSFLNLPGGISTYFTSLGWYYADGYQQQRNGVKINTIVSPTVAGIRQGRDEILEAAFDCLTIIDPPIKKDMKVFVYPNPASNGLLNIEVTLEANTDISISILDLTGKSIKHHIINGAQGNNVFGIELKGVAPGLYLLKLLAGNDLFNVKVEVTD